MAKKDETYNGWKNKSTQNVSLWLENTDSLYFAAVDFMKRHPESKRPYSAFIHTMCMNHDRTPDGFKWLSDRLDYPALNEMMRELVK